MMRRSVEGVKAVFPMYKQPYLTDWLPRAHRSAIESAVAEIIEQRDASQINSIVAELVVEPITLGGRYHDQKKWGRTLTAGQADPALLQRGIYPGQSYQHHYDVYRLEVVSGAEMISVGVNGGHQVDPMFVHRDGHWIVIRAADDAHRDQQINEIAGHIAKANATIDQWNAHGLPEAVRAEIARRTLERTEGAELIDRNRAAGFEPTPTTEPERLPLPDTKRHRRATRPGPARTDDGLRYNLEEDQFAAIVDCMTVHRHQVETLPGYGAYPDESEERHRDRLLGALNLRFRDATGESFSKQGKTDIRVVVGDHSYFYAECKIWDGPGSASEAVDQLVERYLTYRDRHGAVVLFVRNVKRPEEVPAKVIDRLVDHHDGQRLNDVHGVPVVSVRTSQDRRVVLAMLMIVVDSAAEPSEPL